MIRVGQVLPGQYPSTFTPEEKGYVPEGSRRSAFDRKIPVTATVEWIHPERRFAVIRFRFASGKSFCECRALRRRKNERS